ncbi:CMRF35-like molecule 7 [Galemys pyrenaicus]|uniref:CMRF35-like molecule 7 n=1 Tax=Galemys pyrenaicus TaxID=202257 RepID=A0A8J6B3N9_GALPY|nr:CMRF35-like molecule 7 [Galemys pyrenaicus]
MGSQEKEDMSRDGCPRGKLGRLDPGDGGRHGQLVGNWESQDPGPVPGPQWGPVRPGVSGRGLAQWAGVGCILGLCLPGCFSLHGPMSVKGLERRSLSVQCLYDRNWETYRKWWCRGASWGSCKILVRSRRDHQKDRTFTVTMEELRLDDADTYWCGIDRSGTDLGVQVKVTVDPVRPLTALSPCRTHHMLLVFLKVPVLLLLVGAVLWLKGPQQGLSSTGRSPPLQTCPLAAV